MCDKNANLFLLNLFNVEYNKQTWLILATISNLKSLLQAKSNKNHCIFNYLNLLVERL